ncbi:Uncharacterised protein [Mycobacteroides abscessus subsp. abscessus]|nr:Uncharacterised protein [Mycobacteroides abscessus subsp. abscessus]
MGNGEIETSVLVQNKFVLAYFRVSLKKERYLSYVKGNCD